MKILVRLALALMSPFLVVLYWRNSYKEVGNLHAHYELNYD